MLLPLLLVAAVPETAIDAERAFNAAAQAEGQWTAFRKFAAPDAIMFVPEPTNAQAWLKDRKDPPKSVEWAPAQSFVSCDGSVAVNTGPWKRPNSVGYFTTVWVKQRDGHWKWVMDSGDALTKARPLPDEPLVRRASCAGKPQPPAAGVPQGKYDTRHSDDSTLIWRWNVALNGARSVEAFLWNGSYYDRTVFDYVPAPK